MAINWEKLKENAKKQDEAKYGAAKPETHNASPVVATRPTIAPKIPIVQAQAVPASNLMVPTKPTVTKTPNMSQLEEQRLQAAKNEDWFAVDQINAQMKALRAAGGQQTLADRVQDTVSGTVYTEIGQTAGALGMLGREGNKLERWGEQTTQQGEEQIQGAKTGLGTKGQFLVDLGVGATQLAGDIGLSALAPGAGLAAMGVRAFGGGAQQARQEGAARGEQLGYGAASAAASILVERIANVAGPFKKAFGNGVLNKALDKVTAKPAGKLLISALSEGGEEMLEAALDPALQKLTYNPDAEYNEDVLAEMLYSGALGAVLGGFGGVDVVTGRGKTTPETAENAGADGGTGKEYVGDMPRNVEKPYITSPNLSASNYLENGETIETAYGNKHRKTVEQNAEKRLGVGPNRPAYLVASNVTKNGEIYYAKITRESLGKMLYTEKNQRLPVERLVLVDNLEKAFDESVWASSEGDRKNRPQINGFDRLRTSFYIDGKPYYADIVVKVVQQGKEADSENVVYFLEPESIEVIKKVDPRSPTLERHAPKIFFGDSVSTTKTVSQKEPTVKDPYDIMPKLTAETIPAKAQETLKKTENALLNLEGVTPERRKAFTQAQKIAERFGATLNVATLENGAGGRYLNGQITIDPNTENPVRQVLVHELTHHMETSGLYQDFSKQVMDYMQRDMGIDLDDMRLQIMEDYAARGTALDSESADRELVAKFAEDMLFRDEKAVRRLLEKDRNLFQRIYDWIRNARLRVKGTAEERFLMEAESLYKRALQQAGTMEGSAEAQNTFGGVNARTADLKALATAQQMEAQGMNADAIRRETKWFRGMDGKWRFEIDDSGMKYFRSGDAAFTQNHPEYAEYQGLVNQMLMGTMTPEQEARMRALNDTWGREKTRLTDRLSGGAARLQDIIQHDALFEAYPELRNVHVRFVPMGSERGQYNRRTNTITLNENIKNAPQNTIVHEVQHAIQQEEDFAGGASPEYWEDVLRNDEPVRSAGLEQAERKLMEFLQDPKNAEAVQLRWALDNAETDEDYQAIIEAAEQNGSYEKLTQYEQLQWDVENKRSRANNMVPTELYRNTAGEIEAREAAYRRELTPEQRELKMPTLGDANTVFAERPESSAEYVGTTADGVEVYETSEAVKNMPYRKRMETFMEIMQNQYRGRTAKFVAGGNVYYAKFDEVDLRKNIFGDKKSTPKGWKAKINTGADGNIFELVENAQYSRSGTEKGKTTAAHQNLTGWEYFVKTVQIDGRVYDLLANVRKKLDGEYVYSIQLKENKNKTPAPPRHYQNGKAKAEIRPVGVPTDVSDTRVAQEATTVKNPYDIMPKLDPEGKYSQGRGFRELYQKQQETMEDRQQTVMDGEKDPYDIMPKLTATTIPAKAKETLTRTENALLRRIGRALSVPVGVQRSDLKEIVRSISNEYLRDGKVSQESLDTLFEEAYERGIETDTEYYDQHKDIKNLLRTTAVSISKEDQSNIADYNDFRKAAMGTLRISNDGTPVDVLYARLSEQDHSLFPESITHPADQLQRMFEVGKGIQKVEKTLNDYYGEDAETFKAWAKRDFNDAVNGALTELNNVRRFAEEAARKQAAKMANTPEQVKEAYESIRAARKKRERAVNKHLLIDRDNAQVSRLLKGEIQLSDLDPKRYNVRGIREVYEAKLEYEQIARVIREYKKQHSQQLRDEAEVLLKDSVNWKDKKAGMLYSRETMDRNIRDIVPDRETADRIIRKYFAPVHSSNAAAIRAKNAYRDRVKKLGLSRKVAQGNEVSEAHAVQLLGEAEDNIRVLQNSKEKNPMRDGQTLQEWQGTVETLKNNNPNMDWAKVDRAVIEFRAIYDELFQKMNEVRLRNGYEPVAYRQGYFPHFQPGETGLLASFGAALGITTDVTDLPTSINGMTHTFKPGITWFGHAQERKGFNTEYDAVQGFDKYIEGAADVIYQTDNIQRLRALANQIRYRAGDEGLKRQIDEINANENLTEDQKQAAIEQTRNEGGFALSNFVVELEEYTNLLANKKSRYDRNMEQAMGRRMYNIIKGLEGRVAANMVAVNPGSWLTNFIPITQGMASLNTKALLKGMWDTLKAYKVDDGMVELSTFLTNRRGSDPLVKTWAQDWSAKASKPMAWIDSFTADTLVRSRYNQNISEGMSVAEALEEADAWAAKVMADRSKGAMPTRFNRHNPLTKAFTQFQLEVNNEYSYLFKDVPDEMREKGLKALATALMKMFVGAYLYNEVYEHFIGRRPALDPIGILVETGKNLAGGGMDAYEVLTAAGKDVAENLPFVGGLMGGGRLPISSALPNIENLGKAVFSDDWDRKKRWVTGGKEVLTPILYLGAPFGGGQIKKAAQGVNAVRKGGSYTVNSRGEDILQYPILSDTAGGKAMDYLQAAVFGKSSMPEAQEWVKQGFNSLSGPETATYQELTAAGENGRASFDLLQELGDVEKTETESKAYRQRSVLREADLSDKGKSVLFYNLLAGEKEQELMDAASEADREKSAGLLMDMKDAELHKGDTAKKAKYYALLESDVSDEMKIAVYNKYVTDSKEEEIRNMLNQGVKFNDWLQFEAKTGNLSSDDDATRKEKVIGALRDLNLSEDKKAAMYFASAATDSDKEKQQELEASSGITRTQYWQYQEAVAGLSLKKDKLVAIDSLDLTPQQKTALYFANRWAESTLDEAPWYGKSSKWDIVPKLTGTTKRISSQSNPFLVMPKLTGTSGMQQTAKGNPFLKMPKL